MDRDEKMSVELDKAFVALRNALFQAHFTDEIYDLSAALCQALQVKLGVDRRLAERPKPVTSELAERPNTVTSEWKWVAAPDGKSAVMVGYDRSSRQRHLHPENPPEDGGYRSWAEWRLTRG